MNKPYIYNNNTINVSEGEIVEMEIVFPDPATEAHTFVNCQGDNDFEIIGDGPFGIGPFTKELAGICVIGATTVNYKADVNDVRFTLMLNDEEFVVHSNPKAENELPQLIIIINFILS